MTLSLVLCLHVLAAALWVGGMAAFHFAVRPAAVAVLAPPQRLPMMSAAIGRFLGMVGWAIVVLLASGIVLIASGGGLAMTHWSVHAMVLVGLAMMAIYAHIRWSPYRRLAAAVAASTWPDAAAAMDRVRKLVAINLVLGTAVFVLAVVGRVL